MKLVVVPHIASKLPASLTEVSGLFRHLRHGLLELDALDRKTQAMESELQSFLENYYARILPLSARLERLRYRKTHGVFPNKPLSRDITGYTPLPNNFAKRKKSLFRSLAKRCHPDNRREDVTIDIAEVYEAKTISALWLLEIRCSSDSMANDNLATYLEQQRAEIARLTLEAQAHVRHIMHSNEWELKERVCDAALEGVDLIDHIQHQIEKQITALQQYFVKPRKLQPV